MKFVGKKQYILEERGIWMKVAVLSASPKQQLSLTLQTVRALQKMCKEDEFDISFIKDVNNCADFEEKAKDADLILVLSSLYHFNVHGQLIAYLKNIKLVQGKPITYISTSGGNMDIPAHNFLRSFARTNGLKWIRSLSLLDEDILKEKGREELYRWFLYVKDVVNEKKPDEKSLEGMVVKVIDAGDDAEKTEKLAKQAVERYKGLGATVDFYNLREKTIKGCIACFGCYTNNVCVIKDDFDKLTEELYKDADMIVIITDSNYNQFSKNYKYFLDRHVKFGRYSHNYEFYKAYLVAGDISDSDMAELNQHTLTVDSLESNCMVDIYREEEFDKMIAESTYACSNQLYPQRNTYYYGLNLQFANLAYRLQRMTPKDYEYFKGRGYYELPQIITQTKPISNLEEGRMSCKMRLIAFEEMLSALDGPPKLTKRGTRTKLDAPATGNGGEAENKKKGFGLFKKK